MTHAHKRPDTIRRMLASKGYQRTSTAILVKLKRHGGGTGKNADLDHYTAGALAVLFGVDGKTVSGWIARGWLKAQRRGTARTAAQGGDEWSIHRRAVRAFVIDNIASVDFRKLDKFWLVELLTSAGPVAARADEGRMAA
ncbi:hypothetical protein [Rhodopseudomonas sp.]|uniref:hypothetical protein n=1 Tax=Rhodopseudomonas sp. TaxID=1078 RepID=UPI003B3A4317